MIRLLNKLVLACLVALSPMLIYADDSKMELMKLVEEAEMYMMHIDEFKLLNDMTEWRYLTGDVLMLPADFFQGSLREASYSGIDLPDEITLHKKEYWSWNRKSKAIGEFIIGELSISKKNQYQYSYYYDKAHKLKFFRVMNQLKTISFNKKTKKELKVDGDVIYDINFNIVLRFEAQYFIDHSSKKARMNFITYDRNNNAIKKEEGDFDYCYFVKKTYGECN